jgi:adenylate cyclase
VQDAAEIETWLLTDATRIDALLALFEEFVWRLVAAGLPLDRAGLHTGTLHPLLAGFTWSRNIVDGLCDEVQFINETLQEEGFLASPLAVVFRTGQTVRLDLTQPDDGAALNFPIAGDLRTQGFTEYAALPMGGSGYYNVTTMATRRQGGFSEAHFATVTRLLRLLSLHVERHIARRIAENIATTYLGADAGAQVLQGSIRRGVGRRINAVIWVSDLRGYTELSDQLAPEDMLAVLNAYFSIMAGTVANHGGEVLKFIGDGLLAVFPLDRDYGGRTAATVAVAAAQAALAAERQLGLAPSPELDSITGWRPLRSGIGLHVGEVFYGNIGAADRLDFTVIGRAVNTASRIEGLTKTLNHPLLMSAEVAQGLTVPPLSLGTHALRGVGTPIAVFTPTA